MTKEQHIDAIRYKPVRVQRKRTKGWNMPENTVYVGRGSKWGNPYKVGRLWHTPYTDYHVIPKNNEEAVRYFDSWCISYKPSNSGLVKNMDAYVGKYKISELKGKNLACWCPLDEPCHADVLLEIANRPRGNY